MSKLNNLANTEHLAKTYKQLSSIEHVLLKPDTYVGSVDKDEITCWTMENDKMITKTFNAIPALYKCFDEGIVNARDQYIRMLSKFSQDAYVNVVVKNIKVTIEDNTKITIFNDGNGIDVAKHPENDMWIPEMIFGHMRTSTNYNDEEKKITGGKNGFGFKLVLIFSKWGSIETHDHIRGLTYTQEFKNNLSEICKPTIRKNKSKKPYTKVSWIPDYARFGCVKLSEDMFNLLKRRTYDIAAVTDKSVKVHFNNTQIPVKTFDQYVSQYIGDKSETKRFYESPNERWEYCVCISPSGEFAQRSFVNGIDTRIGGTHVDYVLKQIINKLIEYINKKKKVKVKPTTIKEQLMIFLNCTIENPSFDSQIKENLKTPSSKFGSKCLVSDQFVERIAKMGVMEQALSLNEIKENKNAKKSDGKKTKTLYGIKKLVDANFAGGPKSNECTLVLCEGDSAKAGVVSGLSKEDRNYIGVFALKGKPMNTCDMPSNKINSNEEIGNLIKILGLEILKKYNPSEIKEKLRYGKVLFMTDQDLDGSHIKALGINLFHSHWHELSKLNFLGFMNTPILKAKKGKDVKVFYNEQEYHLWQQQIGEGCKSWTTKYYKGLGTSTSAEFKEYFKNKKIVNFVHDGKQCDESVELVFRKDRSDDRKEWLGNYDKNATLDTSSSTVSYTDFINCELKHFSKYDCDRSIPSMVDGLKIGQRKILYGSILKNMTREIKVAQLSGYVSEKTLYHHGEASLNKTIIGMSQEFVGSNNIAILQPNGQFGTRLMGGKDSASERYIFTQLNPLIKKIFPEKDNPILNYLEDDGIKVEPEFYVPIIPFVLVNGIKGIGTGFSTEIPSMNPIQVIDHLLCTINNKTNTENIDFKPYYYGFKGEVIEEQCQKYKLSGCWKIIKEDVIRITELPIGIWTDDYKQHLESLMDKSKKKYCVKGFNDMSTDTTVDITITFCSGKLNELLTTNNFEKTLNLVTSKSLSNMHLFDHNQCIKKYSTIESIINDFYPIRLETYIKRKEYMINELSKIINVLSNKAKFIREQCEDTLDLRRKKTNEVNQLLEQHQYDKQEGSYDYLINMQISSFIEENVEKLLKTVNKKKVELVKLKNTTIEKMWVDELTDLKESIRKYYTLRDKRNSRKV